MLESLFLTVNQWMTGGIAAAAVGCFLWGMISVLFSPCHMASIPLIVGYVGGQNQTLGPRQGAKYAVAFTVGLFITIALVEGSRKDRLNLSERMLRRGSEREGD